ncbi:hypothetical protein M408DRAFT_333133 [Serendipita vermifera MAFF 305830]|uniref:Uncharacterized protein n=1 Tax=Serendipita vermifera MAFF 305830 TaxID=933852 RepID=A0A0C3ABJ6_SERVB|nr:hypothetical protein M408DRAFT_333133 [Serendipita vermifera MAFF 305830]
MATYGSRCFVNITTYRSDGTIVGGGVLSATGGKKKQPLPSNPAKKKKGVKRQVL